MRNALVQFVELVRLAAIYLLLTFAVAYAAAAIPVFFALVIAAYSVMAIAEVGVGYFCEFLSHRSDDGVVG